jgi:hypothetical protein
MVNQNLENSLACTCGLDNQHTCYYSSSKPSQKSLKKARMGKRSLDE